LPTKVLVIDDDGDILESLGGLLGNEGFEVHCEDSAEGGLERLERVMPDVVILDLVFHGSKTGGFDAARLIRARHPALPVIALSAIEREYALDFARDELSVDAFLVKPARIEALAELIRRHAPGT